MNKTIKQMTLVGPTTTFNFNLVKIFFSYNELYKAPEHLVPQE